LKLLLNEMYSSALAEALRAVGVDASRAEELGLAGASDDQVFAAAAHRECVVLTENVADYCRIAAASALADQHHSGVLIALSSRFSRQREGVGRLVTAVLAVATENLSDRVVYLERQP